MPRILWTIGHSTRGLDELVDVLRHYGIEMVVDVRTVPRSRKNPQFNKEDLGPALQQVGIEYVHVRELGGLRKAREDSTNMAWRDDGFRGFADYMQTPGFEEGIERLVGLAESKRTAIMCAEILPWQCHRSLIADALIVRGFEVVEIFDAQKSQPHKLTPFAIVEDGKVTYPAQSDISA